MGYQVPKLIVYVKADTWKKVEAGYGPDAPALMRNLSVEAIEEFLSKDTSVRSAPGRDEPTNGDAKPLAPPPHSDSHFKPDFK